MTITYTNHVETITDALRGLLLAEFRGNIRQSKLFEPDQLMHGEYISYYLSEQPIVGMFTDGETRDYTFNMVYYFDSMYSEFKTLFDEVISDKIERLKRLFDNNRSYSPSDVYKWHTLTMEPQEGFYMRELEDEELKGYEHIYCVPIILTITRSDINQ